jgi:hypothetical protein
MITRRKAIRQLGLGTGALALAPFAQQLRAEAAGNSATPPKRFVFVIRSNGILNTEIQPVGLEHLVKTRANGGWQTRQHLIPLSRHPLHHAMAPLEPLKNRVTIFQGLSGKMCKGSHNAAFGALGAYASKTGGLPARRETIDGALAKALGGVFPHLAFTMEDLGKSIAYPPLSALGPNQTLPYYADPMLAYQDLFGTVATGGGTAAAIDIDRNVLDFMVDDVKRFQQRLSSGEKEKLGHYLHGFEALQQRQAKLVAMNKTLARVAPALRDRYTSEIEIERLKAHFELAASSLIGGLTQVTAIRADHLRLRLGGLGLGDKTVHQIGHMIEGQKGGAGGGDFEDGKGEFATRAVILEFHMQLIAELAAKLDAVPEGDGTMLDNTVILYLSDHGDRHHSKFHEWPMIALGNINSQFKAGHYLQVPGYGSTGHRTIANLYLSLLHAAGHPRNTFGDKDLQLESSIDQTGPLAQWMT